jgi:ABC-type glycerol-3-phosphate transport system substrate-binding protein
MKKLAVVCALLVTVSLVSFVGCAKKASGPVTLTVWGRDVPDDTSDHAYIKALLEGFKAKYPEITVDYIALGDPGLADKTKIAMAADQAPDIFQSWGGSVMGGYADAGRLLDLTAELKDIPGSAAASSAMSWGGKTYGVAPFFAVAGIFYNIDLFAANGITVPTTVAEMEAACDKLLAKGIQPFAVGAKDKWPALATYMYLVNRIGGDAFGAAQKRTAPFDGDTFIKAAELYQKWFTKGYFGAKPLGEGYGDAQQLMATGKAAMHVTGSWMCSQYSNKEFTTQNLGFAAFPVIDGGKGLATDCMGMTDIGFAASLKGAEKKDAIVKFMTYAMSVEACNAEPGRICSVPGVESKTALTGQASAVFAGATSVQFWWDQDLPPTVTSPLNDTFQTFFIPGTDVKAEMTKFEKLCVENISPVK